MIIETWQSEEVVRRELLPPGWWRERRPEELHAPAVGRPTGTQLAPQPADSERTAATR